jgi:4-hydroxyphenylpyruvate dioxygenase
MANQLGIKGFDYVEFYVGSAKMVSYWFAKGMGIPCTGYLGPETGHRDRISFFHQKNNCKFLVTSAVQPETYDIQSFTTLHGDGVKRWAVQVEDVEKCFTHAIKNGAIWVRKPQRFEDENGYVEEAAIRMYDDAELVYVNSSNYKGILKPGYKAPQQRLDIKCEDTGLKAVDHVVGNVRENEMNFWAEYFNKTMDFETFVEFGPGDISTKFSALLSKVVRSKDGAIKNPINEPYKGLKKSQIQEYIDQYRGTGIQHVAITTDNILKTISSMRANGVEFLAAPDSYYEALREKKYNIKENIDDLQKHGILCDWENKGAKQDDAYLLQLFTD